MTVQTRCAWRFKWMVLIAACALGAGVAGGAERAWAVEEAGKSPGPGGADEPTLSLAQRWGVEVVSVRLAAAGHMVDFRYRVVDPEKARPLFARRNKPQLVEEATGRSLTVASTAKTGPLRSSNDPIAGRTYFIFFGNPGDVKAGSRVSVAIGDFRAENLLVE